MQLADVNSGAEPTRHLLPKSKSPLGPDIAAGMPCTETLPFLGVSEAPKCEFEALRTSHARLRVEVAATWRTKGSATVGVAPRLDTRRWRDIACIGRGHSELRLSNVCRQVAPEACGLDLFRGSNTSTSKIRKVRTVWALPLHAAGPPNGPKRPPSTRQSLWCPTQ